MAANKKLNLAEAIIRTNNYIAEYTVRFCGLLILLYRSDPQYLAHHDVPYQGSLFNGKQHSRFAKKFATITNKTDWFITLNFDTSVWKKIDEDTSERAYAIVAWSGLLGSLTTAASAAYLGHFELPSLLSPLALGSYLFVIFAGGLIAMIFWNKGTGIVGPSQAAVFMNIMPLVGIICGVLFLDEQLLISQAIGGVLILGGVYLTTQYRTVAYRLAKYFTRRQRKRQPLR